MYEEDSLTGGDLITIKHRRTVSNPARTIVIPHYNSYWNSNKEEG
jgi:hypothetical protein